MVQEASVPKVGVDLPEDHQPLLHDPLGHALEHRVEEGGRLLQDRLEDTVQGTLHSEVLKHTHGELGESLLVRSPLPAVLVQHGDRLEDHQGEVFLGESGCRGRRSEVEVGAESL